MQAAQQQNVRQAVIKFLLTATDKGCLSEVLRFLHTAVKGPSSSVWLGLVSDDSEPALARIVWMTDNTLDRVLLER